MDHELSNDQKLAETATPNKHTQVSGYPGNLHLRRLDRDLRSKDNRSSGQPGTKGTPTNAEPGIRSRSSTAPP